MANQKKSLNRKKQKTQKNVSLSEVVQKITKVVKETVINTGNIIKKKKPFGGKGGRKKKLTEKQIIAQKAAEHIAQLEKEDQEKIDASNAESSYDPASGFFYTDENFITRFDDSILTEYIQAEYPHFNTTEMNDSLLKKTILEILNNDKFINDILEKYDITILDFFKYLCRNFSVVFKGLFISKIQKILKTKAYADIKQPNYRFRQLQNK